MLLMVPFDIIIKIFNLLDLKTQLNFKQTHKHNYNNLHITNLNCPSLADKLNDVILSKYIYIKSLYVSDESYITDNGIKGLVHLESLIIKKRSITDYAISNLYNLLELEIENTNITINGIKNLKLLQLYGSSFFITNQDIKKLNMDTLIDYDMSKPKFDYLYYYDTYDDDDPYDY